MKQKTFTLKSLLDTNNAAKWFVENLLKTRGKICGKNVNNATVVALKGDLGVGKTTFVKAVAGILGIRHTVTSPTFVIEKTYKISEIGSFTHLIHIDAYRLENGTELLSLGFKEVLEDPRNLVFIEWPERVAEVLPRTAKTIRFRAIKETTRVLTIIC